MSAIVTQASRGLLTAVIATEGARTGDLLAQQRGEASALFRRQYGDWPEQFYQTVDGQPAYPPLQGGTQ